MCFIIAKKMDDIGCVALQIEHGQPLADLKRSLHEKIGYDKIQIVTISRPSAYGEYEPYHFVDTPKEFTAKVMQLL